MSCRAKLSFAHWTVVCHPVCSGTKDAWGALVSYSWVEFPLVSVARGGEEEAETALPEQVGPSHRPPKGASETLGDQAQGGACKTSRRWRALCAALHRLRSCSICLLSQCPQLHCEEGDEGGCLCEGQQVHFGPCEMCVCPLLLPSVCPTRITASGLRSKVQ